MSKPATPDTLNDLMELDHVIRVLPDGTVTDGPEGVYAPDVYGDEETGRESIDGDGWEFSSYGYSGQHGTTSRDPGMHDSEYIGGELARDILATPGVYVAVPVYWPSTDEDGEGDWEGWVVVRLTEQ